MKLSHLLTSSTLLVALAAPFAQATDIAQGPLYTSRQVTPLNMLVMGRDHKLYNEAYNDASDLDGDNLLDVRFKPSITYFGYFDAAKCYDYTSGIFVPKNVGTTGTWTDPVDNVAKAYIGRCTASGTAEWSGNFLNYLTTSRIDALRKVLYGGKRSVDTPTSSSTVGVTVLERSSIPQDAHAWGKEYTSVAVDGYNIADYTPLTVPVLGRRHLFANTTLGASTTTSSADPLLRVLENAAYRIWEWVSIEQPVAGDKCLNGGSGPLCTAGGGTDTSHPANSTEFASLIDRMKAIPTNLVSNANGLARNYIYKDKNGRRYVGSTTLNGPGDTASVDDDNYVSVLEGKLQIATTGSYTFYVNGDDAVEVLIDGASVAGYYGGHGVSGTACDSAHSGTVNLTAGDHDIQFRYEEVSGSDLYNLTWTGPGITGCAVVPYIKPTTTTPAYGPDKSTTSASAPRFSNLKLTVYTRTQPTPVRTDYVVRNRVCVAGLLEDNCANYTTVSGQNTLLTQKPVGLLQDYGFSGTGGDPKMRFGLLTGSYTKNLSGGVLRRAVANISDEIIAGTGVFSSVNGIIRTIDKLKLVGFNGSEYNVNCGRISTRELKSGECRMWGNPIAEMMYEATRYFAGKKAATASFTYSGTSTDDQALDLPLATWDDPYTQTGVRSCSTPVQTVISDINPSYDTDELPGSYWQASSFSSDMSGLNVGSLATDIWSGEFGTGASKLIFIGETGGVKDGAPSAKVANTFRNTRGLAPEEPTKYGGYYAAAIAYYGRQTALNALSKQKMSTFSVALASPLPQLKIPVGGREVTLVPFAKSVGGNSISAAKADYQPTNAIVDFYVESISADRTSGAFRVNFEDTEQGADYDMDAIAKYTYQVNSNGTLTVNMSSDYAAGGIIQHMGYVISGTQSDGVYLEVRDADTAVSGDVNYYLDTGTRVPNSSNNTTALPLVASRTFTPGSTGAAGLLKDPLWYAAKWGGFNDRNGNNKPDIRAEWTSAADTATDPDPDNYFLVTNALGLRAQLDKAFSDILASLSSSASAAASTGAFVPGTTQVVQARFRTSDWSGELIGYQLLSSGAIGQVIWNSAEQVPTPANRKLYTLNISSSTATGGVPFVWGSLSAAQRTALQAGTPQATAAAAQLRLNYLRGDQSQEKRYTGGIFRNRTNGVLGDIINSNPQYVGTDSRIKVVPESLSGSYETYRAALRRPDMVYAGGNDGMLHGFCADNCGTGVNRGQELIGYVPNFLLSSLYLLTQPEYTHRYYVDGVSKASDVRIGNSWKTVVVGSAGAGGKGLFALDVTAPGSFDGTKVLWEFTPASETAAGLSGQDLGYTIGSPQIALVNSVSNSVAIFTSGFDSTSGRVSVYVVDIGSGAVVRRIQLPTSAGLSVTAPALLDSNNDGITDYVYVGDSNGQLWRVDLTSSVVDNWNVGLGGSPLLTARNAAGGVQPMTAAPLVGTPDTEGNVMVYIGTGRYLGVTDKTDTTIQAFYGVKDKWLKTINNFTTVTRADLQEQTILTEGNAGDLVGGQRVTFDYRITSANDVSKTKDGWYLTLTSPGTPSVKGERVTTQAQISGNKVIFVTTIPPVDTCEFGGSSWLMELNITDGKKFDTAIFDTNGDGFVDDRDALVNGRGWNELTTPPALIPECPNGTVCKVTSGSSGNLSMVLNNGDTTIPKGRISWRQLE
jgi:type IV pilus assembly protein PilY1